MYLLDRIKLNLYLLLYLLVLVGEIYSFNLDTNRVEIYSSISFSNLYMEEFKEKQKFFNSFYTTSNFYIDSIKLFEPYSNLVSALSTSLSIYSPFFSFRYRGGISIDYVYIENSLRSFLKYAGFSYYLLEKQKYKIDATVLYLNFLYSPPQEIVYFDRYNIFYINISLGYLIPQYSHFIYYLKRDDAYISKVYGLLSQTLGWKLSFIFLKSNKQIKYGFNIGLKSMITTLNSIDGKKISWKDFNYSLEDDYVIVDLGGVFISFIVGF